MTSGWHTRLREARAGKQRKAIYAAYLESATWRLIRSRALERDRFCQDCGARRELQVHHLTYERAGGLERDGDLVTLCTPCHKQRHGRRGVRGFCRSWVTPNPAPQKEWTARDENWKVR